MSIQYRADIDGLRAIAVISILLFHADFSLLPGGFVGVDIFFVISGYLITSLIHKELVSDNFSFKNFYLRRIRRLLPSLIIVMLSTWIAGFFLLSEESFKELAETAISATFFISNWHFLGQSNYFDSALTNNALLHTWSLSIEEQYYLLWPLALFILHRFLRNSHKIKLIIISLLIIGSLTLSTYLVYYSELQNSFFNTASRVWELFFGGLVALTLSDKNFSNIAVTFMRLAGLTAITATLLLFNKTTPFPGVSALLPVLGTCLLLIASNSSQGFIFKLLTLPPVRFLGNISYSLYLWHWPLLVYANIWWPTRTKVETLFIILIAVLLSIITTYAIENPIRYKKTLKSNRSLLIGSGFSTLIILILLVSTVWSNGLPERWQHKDIDIQSIQYNFDNAFNVGSCFIDDRHNLKVLLDADCLIPQAGKVNILIIGDSFAAHLMPGLEYHFPAIHFNQATASACRALHGFAERHRRKKWACPALNRLVFSTSFLAAQQYSAIILASDWQYGRNGRLDGPEILKTISYLKTLTDIPILVLGNTPVYINDTRIVLRSHAITGLTQNNRLKFRDGILEMELFNQNNIDPSIFISMLDRFCENNVCPILTSNNKMVHFGIHLTEWGAIEVIGASKNKLENIFNFLEPMR